MPWFRTAHLSQELEQRYTFTSVSTGAWMFKPLLDAGLLIRSAILSIPSYQVQSYIRTSFTLQQSDDEFSSAS